MMEAKYTNRLLGARALLNGRNPARWAMQSADQASTKTL